MRLAKVVGHIWATRKEESLTGLKLLVVQAIDLQGRLVDHPIIAGDRIGAGAGETVLLTSGSSARKPINDSVPVDAMVVAIVDTVELERAKILTTEPVPE